MGSHTAKARQVFPVRNAHWQGLIYLCHISDLPKVENDLKQVYATGIRSVAICLMHSFTYPGELTQRAKLRYPSLHIPTDHEKKLQSLCEKIGFTHITLSSDIMPMIKIVPRGTSATADAYLTPCIQKYINGFFSGFDEGIRDPEKVKVEFMQSDGGLAPVDSFSGFRAILSGPAGGVVGYALTSWEENGEAVIGFDMGGMSLSLLQPSMFALTICCRYQHGRITVRGPVRTCFRDNNSWRDDSGTST